MDVDELVEMFSRLRISNCNKSRNNKSFRYKQKIESKLSNSYMLFDHQIDAIKWCLHRYQNSHYGINGGILSLQMGMGKTLIALSLIYNNDFGIKNNLLVCNKAVIPEIKHEITKFFGIEADYFILHPEFTQRVSIDETIYFIRNSKAVLTTYDVINSLRKALSTDSNYSVLASHFFEHVFDLVFFDESQRIKKTTSMLFKSLRLIRSHTRFCLTGTPFTNHSSDIYPQFLLCGFDRQIKRNKNTFKKFNLSKCLYVREFETTQIKLPDKHVINLEFNLNKYERSIYESVLQSTKTLISNGTKGFTEILLMFMKLRQICISPNLVKDYNCELKKDNNYLSTKFSMIINNIKNSIDPDDVIIIFSAFTNALNVLQELLLLHNICCISIHSGMSIKKREKIITHFRLKKFRVLLMTNNIGALGLNLTIANHIILLEPWWNNSTVEQAIARVWRVGQQKNVFIWRYNAIGTIEQKLLDVCDEKYKAISSEIPDQLIRTLLE